MQNLIQKYNVPGPRYTSYPTVPYWNANSFSCKEWELSFCRSFKESNDEEGISLYIHLPYCESLCTFCGCHKRITKQHAVELPYIDAVLKEWEIYVTLLGSTPRVKEIHLGGGTPTFFSPENLRKLIEGIFKIAVVAPDHEFSFEGHPNSTTREHLQTLYDLGFRRVSYGVQDYSPVVQQAIHRVQTYDTVRKVTDMAREVGYTSVSHDLVYGLPFQTYDDVIETMNYTIPMLPDRIAFYSYAHVPWMKGNGQRGFNEKDLPSGAQKRKLYETGKSLLTELDYEEIGMDHFAQKTDKLYKSMVENKLHRNFMGYTSSKTKLLIGLGASSISDSWYGFAQNEKSLETYLEVVNSGKLPVMRGHILNEKELIIRRHILNLMCHFYTNWSDESMKFEELPEVLQKLSEMEHDELIVIKEDGLKVLEEGKPFVRNVCMAFDLLLQKDQPKTKIFSMTI